MRTERDPRAPASPVLPLMAVAAAALLVAAGRAPGAEAPVAHPEVVVSTCDDAAAWSGGTLDTELKQEGAGAIRWEHATSAALVLNRYPTDWSGYNHLRFRLHSAKATGSAFILYIGSENPQSEGMDYYSERIRLDFTGWRRFDLDLTEISRSREPLGWQTITRFCFNASGWDNTPNPEAVVHVDDIRLTSEPVVPVVGPRLTDEAFFAALDVERPDLAAVKAAVAKADWPAARAAFAKHVRDRQAPRWTFDWRARPGPDALDPKADHGAADKIVAHELSSCGVPYTFGPRIDWAINPTPLKYAEWTWQLSRHPFWSVLGRTYWATGDETYAKEYVAQITAWIEDNPVPVGKSGNTVGSRWRTIETGIRMFGSWPDSFFRFLSSPSFTDAAVVTVVKSMVEHARHLQANPTSGNWLAMEMNGLFHVGALFPEFRDAAEWRRYAIERLHTELSGQVYPDGAQIELAPGYHGVSLGSFLGTLELARLNEVPLPDDYQAQLERMYEYYTKIAMPSGEMPALNDSGWGSVRGSLGKGFSLFPARTDFQSLATEGKQGTAPAFTSVSLPWSGWYVMRSGWGRDDLYLHLDAGPFGYGHQHEDKLSILVAAYGRRLLTEGGVYAYDSSAWRRYVLASRAHNTAMVDGLEQSRSGVRDTYVSTAALPNRWLTTATVDYAEGWYDDGYGRDKARPAQHVRRVLFAKPDMWFVVDQFRPRDTAAHRYDLMFHFDGPDAVVDPVTGSVRSTQKDAANLAIVPLVRDGVSVTVVQGQEKPTVQGWVPARGYEVRPVATPVFSVERAGVTTLVWLLVPLRAGQDLPVTAAGPAKATGGQAFEVRLADKRYVLLLGEGPDSALDAAGVRVRAEVALAVAAGDGAPAVVFALTDPSPIPAVTAP